MPFFPKGMGIPLEEYPACTKIICPYHHWFIQAVYPTWDENGEHVVIPCPPKLPDTEEPIHIMWWIFICIFEPCEYLLKPRTDHVPIEAEGESYPNSNIIL